jgi:hypothetical protein
MKNIGLSFFLVFFCFSAAAQTQTIHVFVALCDNEHQGIVKVPESIGNGKDIRNNLYWGAGYGVKNFLNKKTEDWKLVKTIKSTNPYILERLLFKHAQKEVYLLADAYDGEQIKSCIEDFLKSANGQKPVVVKHDSLSIKFGGHSDLLAYVGHDGLMEFEVNINYKSQVDKTRDVIILACYSKNYFAPEIKKAKANPLLWTTHLMAPEAYTLKAAIDGWLAKETGKEVAERAAQTYNNYQKCGIKGARNLFTTGF